jgi:hypothetical protein
MRVVWASAHLPDPSRGGGWGHEYELLRHAAQRHDVLLLAGELGAGETPPAVIADLGVEVRGVAVPARPLPANKAAHLAHLLRHRIPLGAWMVEPLTERLAAAVADAEQRGGVELVHVMPQEAAPVVAAARAPTALFLGDSYWVQASRELAAATSLKDRLRLSLERRNAGAWEKHWYPQADAVASVSPADARSLGDLCGIPVGVVPIPLGDEWFAAPTVARADDLVVIVGALDYWPNVDSVIWFAREIWPLVAQAQPRARLRVVGRRPTADVRAAVAAAGGELLADVPDVRPHYWEATVVPAPIRLGSGVKNKVLHAAACLAPQVGTAFAFDGTDARPGDDVVMAEDAAGLAAAVVRCLTDPDAAAQRARSAFRIAEAHRAERIVGALDELWARALSR